MLTHSPISTKPPNFRRSAIEPVGIVAAVSMNTIWKMKKARMPLTAPSPFSMKPLPPRMPIWSMRSSQTLSVSPHCAERRRREGPLSRAADRREGEVHAAECQAETHQPEADRADAEHHHVHHHRVGHVFGAGEAGLHQGKAGLHEEDQEAGDQHPHHVDRGGEIFGRRAGALGRGDAGEAHQQRQDQERKDQASSKRFTHGIRILL